MAESCPSCTQLEAENEQLAKVLAHMSAALTGNMKPSIPYPGRPVRYVEEGLVIYRAAQLLAERVVKMREGREPTEVEIQAEITWFLKCADKEIASILPDRKIERPVPIPQRKEMM